MPTPITQFNYHLPKELIAQHSVEPRDNSKLMILNRNSGEIKHKHFFDIIDELKAGDVLVFNDTKVFRARLEVQSGMVKDPDKNKRHQEILSKVVNQGGCPASYSNYAHSYRDGVKEVFLLRCIESDRDKSQWQALIRPGKKVRVGDTITIKNIKVVVKEKHKDGIVDLIFPMNKFDVLDFTDKYGLIPVPPYISEIPSDANKYQTVYAKYVGSVAAPTAGFHFTNKLIDKIKQKGIETCFVTLHVGIGTFRPVQTETIEEHEMHSEFVQIPVETAKIINRAKKEKRRVIAVGTTTVRSLEGIAILQASPSLPRRGDGGGLLQESGFIGDVNIFIKPGFEFKIVDAIITNFHLPKSTLLVLISSFAGRENVLNAYKEAVENNYRFFSFGDAMFIG